MRHVGYGVREAHCQTVGAALLKTLGQGLGEDFTPPVREAWTRDYGLVTEVMVAAAREPANTGSSGAPGLPRSAPLIDLEPVPAAARRRETATP